MASETQDEQPWSEEEKRQLRRMRVHPSVNYPGRLRSLVAYCTRLDATVYGLTQGKATVKVSRGLARKILGLVREGKLDWVLARGARSQVDLEVHRRLLIDLACTFRDHAFSQPSVFPSDVVEKMVLREWGLAAPEPKPAWERNDLLPFLADHLEGSAVWRVLEEREEAHTRFRSACWELRRLIPHKVVKYAGIFRLQLVDSEDVARHLRGGDDLEALAGRRLGPFLTDAVAVAVVEMLQRSGSIVDNARFLAANPVLSGRPLALEARPTASDREMLWWGKLLLGCVRAGHSQVIDRTLLDVMNSELEGERWKGAVNALDQLHWRPYVHEVKQAADALVRSDSLASAIIRGECAGCRGATGAPRPRSELEVPTARSSSTGVTKETVTFSSPASNIPTRRHGQDLRTPE